MPDNTKPYTKNACMYNTIKNNSADYLKDNAPVLLRYIKKHKIGIKYLLSGLLAAIIQLGLLYLLTDVVGLLYIASSMTAFVVGVVLAFVMQKFWTFRDKEFGVIFRQFGLYGGVAAVNFFLNPILLAFLVEVFDIWYLLAQVFVSIILAVVSFSVHTTITFRRMGSR